MGIGFYAAAAHQVPQEVDASRRGLVIKTIPAIAAAILAEKAWTSGPRQHEQLLRSLMAGRAERTKKQLLTFRDAFEGVYDAGEDILSKGVVGENKNLRTANVLGMVSGGADAISLGAGSIAGALESAGLVADSTGIGAPLGIAMGLVGAGVGVAGAVEDYIGGKKKKQDLQNKLKSAVAKTPAQITPQALATSTAGEVRKVSKGMSAIS